MVRDELQRYFSDLLQSQRHQELADRLRDTWVSSTTIEQDIARMVAATDWALSSIMGQLSVSAQRLGQIEQLIANPAQTAGAELFRNGSYALSEGWLDEAIEDLQAAVDAYRYHPGAWFNLGVALERSNREAEAVDALVKAARFGAPKSPVLAATAVLVAAGLYRRLAELDRSEAILLQYQDKFATCAEIPLALAVHHHDTRRLAEALALAPMLATDARAAGVASLERLAAEAGERSGSPIQRLKALERAMANVSRAAHQRGLGVEDISSDPVVLPDDSVDALLTAELERLRVATDAKRIEPSIRTAYYGQTRHLELLAEMVRNAEQWRATVGPQFNAQTGEPISCFTEFARLGFPVSSASALTPDPNDFSYTKVNINATRIDSGALWVWSDTRTGYIHIEAYLEVPPGTSGARFLTAYADTVSGVQTQTGWFLQIDEPEHVTSWPVGEAAQEAVRERSQARLNGRAAQVERDIMAAEAALAEAQRNHRGADAELNETQRVIQPLLDALNEAIQQAAQPPARIVPFGTGEYLQLG